MSTHADAIRMSTDRARERAGAEEGAQAGAAQTSQPRIPTPTTSRAGSSPAHAPDPLRPGDPTRLRTMAERWGGQGVTVEVCEGVHVGTGFLRAFADAMERAMEGET